MLSQDLQKKRRKWLDLKKKIQENNNNDGDEINLNSHPPLSIYALERTRNGLLSTVTNENKEENKNNNEKLKKRERSGYIYNQLKSDQR